MAFTNSSPSLDLFLYHELEIKEVRLEKSAAVLEFPAELSRTCRRVVHDKMRETNDDGRVFVNGDEHSAVWLNPVFLGIPYTSGTSYGFTPSCYKHSGQGIFLHCGYLQFSCLVDAFRHFLRRLPNFNPSMPPSEEDPAFDCLRQ